MAKSKLTLIIDGNWLLMSRLAVLNNKYVDDNELNKQLKLVMIRSINIVLKNFRDIDNIVFVADGGSWRAEVAIPESLVRKKENGEIISESYKGTRVKSDDFNWDLLFENYEQFISDLAADGINVSREKMMEGDDWCYHWSKTLNDQGTNCIIWSADKDLTQLVTTDKNKCFTVWWNQKQGVVADDFEDDDMDFFFNQSYDDNSRIFRNIVDKSAAYKQIIPSHVIIDKILKGDGSDNIHPIMLRKSKSGSTKHFKISTKDIDYSLDYNNDNEVYKYLSSLYYNKSYVGRIDDSLDEVFEHFKYNRTLVELDKNIYPDFILDIMKENSELKFISNDISKVQSRITAASNNLASIMELI